MPAIPNAMITNMAQEIAEAMMLAKLKKEIEHQTFGVPLQDNRCPFCLGDVYTCGCGKARR